MVEKNMKKTENSAGQVDYVTMSKLGKVTKKVPASMESAIHTINSRFLNRHPEGIDEFVSKKLDMNFEKMEECFSPEQIDAIGIAIDTKDLGFTPILGDQTGIGKGRVLAAIDAYNIMNGHPALYITEHSTSFSDIYREFTAIGKQDIIKPFIMKANDKSARIISEDNGEVIFEPMSSLESKAITVLRHWPDGSELTAIEISTEVADALTYAENKEGHLGKSLPQLSDEDMQWLEEHRRGKHIFLFEGQNIPDSIKETFDNVFNNWINKKENFRPDGNICLTTYTQFNKKGNLTEEEIEKRARSKSKKAKQKYIPDDRAVWLEEMAKNNKMSIVADEIHSASNINSATGYNLQRATNAAWEAGNGVIFGSATWSKDADSMDIYMPCFPSSVRNDDLYTTLKAGGVPLLEIFSRSLVSGGQMIRREHAADSAEFKVSFDEKNYGNNREIIDSIAPILSDIGVLSGAINGRVAMMNSENLKNEIARLGEKKGEASFNKKKIAMRNFSNVLSNIGEALDSSMRIDHTTELAITALKEGRKPVIFLDKTMDSLMQELVNEGRNNERPSYKHILHRLLDKVSMNNEDNKNNLMSRNPFSELQETVFRDVLSKIPNDVKDVNGRGITDATPEQEVVAIMNSNKEESNNFLKNSDFNSYSDYFLSVFNNTVDNTIKSSHKASLKKIHATYTGDELQKKINDTNNSFDKYEKNIKSSIYDRHGNISVPNEVVAFSDFLFSLEKSIPINPGKLIEGLRKKIDDMPDLPVSAIDEISHRIKKAGFSIDEITGRGTQLNENGHIISRLKDTPRNVIKNNFNSGKVDALIINRRGATAIDLHSSQRFKDQRQRELIVHQAPTDIQKFIQGLGRVRRHDQVIKPIINYPVSGMPCELATIAAQNKKLSGMSANTSGSRLDQAMISNVPDILNPVGDMVISEYVSCRPDLRMRLGYDSHEAQTATKRGSETLTHDNGEVIDVIIGNTSHVTKSIDFNEREGVVFKKASAILQRISRMLPFREQENVISEIIREYNARIEELDAQNKNPLKNKFLDGEVKVDSEMLLEGAPINPDSVLWKEGHISEFERPVYVQNVYIKTEEKMLNKNDVEQLFIKGMESMNEDNETMAQYIRKNKDALLRSYMPHGITTVKEALAHNNNNIVKANNRLEKMADTIEQMKPGNVVNITIDGDPKECVILYVKSPKNNSFKGSAAHYTVRVAVPGDVKPKSFSLGSLIAQGATPEIGITGPRKDEILGKFDEEQMNSVLTPRKLLVGNPFRCMALAVEYSLGTLVNFKDDKGMLNSGILIPRSSRVLDAMPVPMRNPDIALKVLENPLGGSGKVDMEVGRRNFKGVKARVSCKTNGINKTYEARIPTTKASNTRTLYKSDSFLKFLDMYAANRSGKDRNSLLKSDEFAKKNNLILKDLNQKEMHTLLQGFMDAGIGIDAGPAERRITQKLDREYYESRFGDAVERTEGKVVDYEKKQKNNVSLNEEIDDLDDNIEITA